MSAQFNQNTTGSSGSCTGNSATASLAAVATTALAVSSVKVDQTQITSHTTSITANGVSGTLTMVTPPLAGLEKGSFTFINSSILASSNVKLFVVGTDANGIPPMISRGTVSSGSVVVNFYNPSAVAQSADQEIDYEINV